MADPVLTATLSGQRAILLSWTFDSNADFQVFWKSSSPPGQEYVLLATTNAFTYTTADLDPSKTYDFYVRANVGATYYYSNVVELFVSCGKGVILEPSPPPSPPAQIFKGNVYACVYGGVGGIFVQGSETGDFISLGQTARLWTGLAASPSGNLYSCVDGGDIYKQTDGIGDFNPMGQTTRNWIGIAASSTGHIYAVERNGDIYKQTNGVGTFSALSQTARNWKSMAAGLNGDVFVAARSGPGGIYKQTNGTGNFIEQGAGNLFWNGVTVAPNGDVYASVHGGDIYKQTGGVGSFVALNQITRLWYGMASGATGDIYACVNDGVSAGNIYKRVGSGDFVGLVKSSRYWFSVAVRNN